jgi:hypothetical protein
MREELAEALLCDSRGRGVEEDDGAWWRRAGREFRNLFQAFARPEFRRR